MDPQNEMATSAHDVVVKATHTTGMPNPSNTDPGALSPSIVAPSLLPVNTMVLSTANAKGVTSSQWSFGGGSAWACTIVVAAVKQSVAIAAIKCLVLFML